MLLEAIEIINKFYRKKKMKDLWDRRKPLSTPALIVQDWQASRARKSKPTIKTKIDYSEDEIMQEIYIL